MKQPSPLVPQGSFEAQAQGKSHVRIAVFTILAIHVIVLGGLLILGCKREDKDTSLNPPADELSAVQPFTNAPDVSGAETNPPGAPANLTSQNSGLVSTPPVPAPAITTPPPDASPEALAVTEHTIVKGDTFATLATKYGVSSKAIQAVNPGVDPRRLKIDQKIKIPAKTALSTASGAAASPAVAADSGDTYTVKSGDTLGKIARAHGTTVKEIQSLNNLSTTQIRVSQKLKMPTKATPATGGSTPAPTPPPAQ